MAKKKIGRRSRGGISLGMKPLHVEPNGFCNQSGLLLKPIYFQLDGQLGEFVEWENAKSREVS